MAYPMGQADNAVTIVIGCSNQESKEFISRKACIEDRRCVYAIW